MSKPKSLGGKRVIHNPKVKIKAQIRRLQRTLKLLDKIERQKKQLRRMARYVERYSGY